MTPGGRGTLRTTIATDAPQSRAPLPALDVSIIEDRHALKTLKPEWNDLVERTRNEPFFRCEYIGSWIEHFAPGAPLRLLAARNSHGRLVGLLPLLEERVSYFGVPLRQWSSPTNLHSYRFDLLADDTRAVAGAFFLFLRDAGGWDALRVTDIPDGGNAWELYSVAKQAGLPVGVYPSNRSVYVTLPDSFEALEATLGGKFRGNLRRRKALLGTKGAVSVEQFLGGPDLAERLEECFAIEASGWKGKTGQPANLDPRIHGFYSSLARRSVEDGSFSLLQLKLDGRPIAFHYGLTRNGVYSLIMTSYDESLRDCSPGHLLVEETIRRCIEAGRREFDFLGCDLDWKRAWSRASRPHSWLFVFRPNLRGRLAHSIKFQVAPAAKRWWFRWKTPAAQAAGGVGPNGE
jgi:CelD/BcsL family acetyltransferase involved in cellulose biosynthesis